MVLHALVSSKSSKINAPMKFEVVVNNGYNLSEKGLITFKRLFFECPQCQVRRLKDRGLIKQSMKADKTVFNLETIR